MRKINGDFKKCIRLLLLAFCVQCNNAKHDTNQSNTSLQFNSLDFEQIKYGLLQTGSNCLDSDCSCANEISAIKNGVNKTEDWALKLVDSWGKFPSALFSGNLYELGGFTQCLNIQRNEKRYKTQYCLGQLILELDYSQILNTNGESIISPEYLFPQPDNGIAITFGLCVSDVCSLRTIEPIMNHLISQKVQNVSVKLIDSTCQFQESSSELRPIDVITLIFLGTILFLISASTCYDILCTIYNRKKSQAYLAFSAYTNGKQLLSYKKSKSPDQMGCLHGIRVISTLWVVLGHSIGMYPKLPMSNLSAIPSFMKHYRSMLIFSAPIAVDTFFVMSGLLVSIGLLKALEKNGRLNLALIYFHRYIRLTPLLAVCILLSVSLFRFTGSGPLWPRMNDVISAQCKQNWWATLLYIQNYSHPDDMCYIYAWYLAVDMQLYFFAPAVVYLIYRFRTRAIWALIVLILACVGCTLDVHVRNGLKTLRQNEKWTLAYYPSHIRFSSWLIGVIAGYYFSQTKSKSIRIPNLFNFFAWTLSLGSMFIIIFINYPLTQLDSTATPFQFGLYDALSRVVWSIALCYIIFACIHKKGGPINSILAHPLWQPLSRICYSIYLMHFFVIRMTMASTKSPFYFSELNAFHTFIGNFIFTVFVSLIGTLAFESPLIIIVKLILPQPKAKVTDEKKEKQIPDNALDTHC